MDRAAIVRADKAHVWHPYTPMDAYIERGEPLVVARASGVRLFDADGRAYLDGNSSWWVAALGHGHPRLLAALARQAETLVHCSLAGTTHGPAAELALALCKVAPKGLSRVFYSDNGSTAIDVAVKMSVQLWKQRGAPKKSRFVALDGAYHGDSIGATSLGGVEVFRRPYAGVLFDCVRAPFPEDGGYARAFEAMTRLVTEGKDELAAVVVEPVVQGAAGMRVYDPAYLRELRALCDRCDVLLVVDEVFTGYGRTGRMWASEHAGVSPDIMCVAKVFSSLFPMAATLTTEAVFDAFRGDKERAFYYGHTFCGNPLGAAVAREVLAVYEDDGIVARGAALAPRIAAAMERLRGIPGVLRTRSLGMIGAADLGGGAGYLGGLGWRVYDEALRRGAYLRPLGDTVYVCPPLVSTEAELDELLAILTESVRAALA